VIKKAKQIWQTTKLLPVSNPCDKTTEDSKFTRVLSGFLGQYPRTSATQTVSDPST
jgi:hypothetical protein